MNIKSNNNSDLERQVREFEEADKLIRETTGADDINEICQKFSNLRDTKEKLKKEKKDLEYMCESLSIKKDEITKELNKLKYQGQDEVTRKEVEDVIIYCNLQNEEQAEKTLKGCEQARQNLKMSEKLIVDIRAAITMITGLLKTRNVKFKLKIQFEEFFNDERNFQEKDIVYKQAYFDMYNSTEKDMRQIVIYVTEICEYLYQRYLLNKDSFPQFDINEPYLNRREENGIIIIFILKKLSIFI